jgi:hypothetical protein
LALKPGEAAKIRMAMRYGLDSDLAIRYQMDASKNRWLLCERWAIAILGMGDRQWRDNRDFLTAGSG